MDSFVTAESLKEQSMSSSSSNSKLDQKIESQFKEVKFVDKESDDDSEKAKDRTKKKKKTKNVVLVSNLAQRFAQAIRKKMIMMTKEMIRKQ